MLHLGVEFAVLKFFAWGYDKGDDLATGLEYVPMPDSVVKMVETMWTAQIKGNDGSIVYQ